MAPLVYLKGVAISQGEIAISPWYLRCDFDIDRGFAYSLLGENMSGKSTLLRYLSGVHHVQAKHSDVWRAKNNTRKNYKTAYLDHSDTMFPELSVLDTLRVSSPGLLTGQSRRIRRDLQALLDNTPQLDGVRPETPLRALSTGGKAILQAARIKTMSPDLILIDEVTSNFDDALVSVFFEEIASFVTPRQSLIMVSHVERDHRLYQDRFARAGLGHRQLRCKREGDHSCVSATS